MSQAGERQDFSPRVAVQSTEEESDNPCGETGTATSANKRAKASTGAGQFVCQTCNKSYSRIENLTRHNATHDAVSRFQCTVCKKRFTRSDLLNRHKKIHGSMSASPGPGQVNNVEVPLRQKTHTPQLSYVPKPLNQYTPPPNGYAQHSQSTPKQYIPVAPPPSQPTPPSDFQAQTAYTAVHQQPTPLPAWDGFMMYDNSTAFNMGSYDADIAWTFDFACTDMPYDFSFPQYVGTPSVGDVSDPGYSTGSHSYQPVHQQPLQPIRGRDPPEEKAEGEEEVSNDWPDNLSRPSSPQPQKHRRRRLDATVWLSVEEEAQRSSGRFSTYPYSFSGNIDYSIRGNQIIALELVPGNQTTDTEVSDAVYPMPNVLEYYLRLYFHHVHDRFPVIHLPTFDISRTPPLLLATMMLAGSSYARSDRGRFSSLFYGPVRIAIMKKQEEDSSFLRSVDNIFTFLLLCLSGTWGGNKLHYEFAEGYRGILVTAARRSRLMDCRPTKINPDTSLQGIWLAWVEIERKKRLGLSIYVYDCQYPSLFNNQMYISKAETTNLCFPCNSQYYEAPNCHTWKLLLGPADVPSATFYLHALNCCLLRRYVTPAPPPANADNFGKVVIVYAIFTHIFEWRQAVSMLNPTGLFMVGGGNSAHDMGEGLRGRRRWLIDALDSFADLYLTPDTSTAAAILHQLAYVSLSVSLSDLHLAAGRLGSKEDGELAEGALRSWANSENAEGTMLHVEKMLDLAHRALRDGSAATASFEVAVALFQGGLVSWAYSKLNRFVGMKGIESGGYRVEALRATEKAGRALREMGCWRMCALFGYILKGFEARTVG